jgi:putative transposase
MIDRTHALPLNRQAEVLRLSRSTLYYRPQPVSPADLAIMRRIDEQHLDYPFAGSRMLRDILRGEGVATGREHVSTLMKRMGIAAIYRRPNTSKPAPSLGSTLMLRVMAGDEMPWADRAHGRLLGGAAHGRHRAARAEAAA